MEISTALDGTGRSSRTEVGSMALNSEDREALQRLAVERLRATADDGWSFLTSEGAVDLACCPWQEVEYEEFDGDVEGMDILWKPERLKLIERGESDPDEEELLQWRREQQRQRVSSACASIACVVPVRIGSAVAGHALFYSPYGGAPEDEPQLWGVFETFEEAKSSLLLEGPVVDFRS
jgi:hypothetical protein